ncbi:MAG: hypothetical protein U0520_00955 [Candidatus Saccharimonadales bacterium]
MRALEDTDSGSGQSLPSYRKTPFVVGFLSILGIVAVLTTTNPGEGGPMAILLFLALLFTLFVASSHIVIEFAAKILKLKAFSNLRLLYTSVVIALGCVFLVGLQTLRQLQLVDIALTVVLEIVLNFYLLRRF